MRRFYRRRSFGWLVLATTAFASPVLGQATQKTYVTGVASDVAGAVSTYTAEGKPNGTVDLRASPPAGPLEWNRSVSLIRFNKAHWLRSTILSVRLCETRAGLAVSGDQERITAASLGSGTPCAQ